MFHTAFCDDNGVITNTSATSINVNTAQQFCYVNDHKKLCTVESSKSMMNLSVTRDDHCQCGLMLPTKLS